MANCPTCAGRGTINNTEFEKRDPFMRHRFEDEIMRYIRSNPTFSRESCLLCVQKHISSAMQYSSELRTAANSGTVDGKAKVDMFKTFLSICGELNLAAEESEQWEDLHAMLKALERSLRYEHILPNFDVVIQEILKIAEKENIDFLSFK